MPSDPRPIGRRGPGRAKHRFTQPERYGVWVAHDRTCQLCFQPVEYADLEIDHYFPEHLEDAPEVFAEVRAEFALPDHFGLNSFSNWVPAHRHHNRTKGMEIPSWSPNQETLVRRNLVRAPAAAQAAERFRTDLARGRILSQVLDAIESRALTLRDLIDLVDEVVADPAARHLPDGAIFLDEGRMYAPDEVVRTGVCRCDRSQCVGFETKVICTFTTDLSDWVVQTGLFHACYDEIILCPRCEAHHPRGHIGRAGYCSAPFSDQANQLD